MATKRFSILLTILLCMVGTNVFAYDYDIAIENADGVTIYYNYINNGWELEVTYPDNYKYSGNVVIPEEATYMNRTRKVASIGFGAFANCYDLTSVTIPNSVTSIGEYAFYGCYKLTSVTIPNSVKKVSSWAFENCIGMTSLTIGNSVNDIDNYAFRFCSSLTSVTIPNSVTRIGYDAFFDCSSLTSVTIPISVTRIDDRAFSGCKSLKSIEIPNSVTIISDCVFADCSSLTSVTIPNNVTSIGRSAFKGCRGLTSVTIGNSVTRIEEEAFASCDIPEVISKIENPPMIAYNVFSKNTYKNASLYIPKGTTNKYMATYFWNEFVFIEEGTWGTDIATVCSQPFMIKAEDGIVSIEGAEDGMNVSVYTIDGIQEGAAIIRNGAAMVNTNIPRDSVAIVKIGNKSVKVIMK